MAKDENYINQSEEHELKTVMDAKHVTRLSVLAAIKHVGNKRDDVYNWLDSSRGHTVEIVIE